MQKIVYSTSLQLQAAIFEIYIANIVGCGAFTKHMSRKNLYAYGILGRSTGIVLYCNSDSFYYIFFQCGPFVDARHPMIQVGIYFLLLCVF